MAAQHINEYASLMHSGLEVLAQTLSAMEKVTKEDRRARRERKGLAFLAAMKKKAKSESAQRSSSPASIDEGGEKAGISSAKIAPNVGKDKATELSGKKEKAKDAG